jgi:hypothetical protein
MVRAVQLSGSRCLVSGISKAMAQTFDKGKQAMTRKGDRMVSTTAGDK